VHIISLKIKKSIRNFTDLSRRKFYGVKNFLESSVKKSSYYNYTKFHFLRRNIFMYAIIFDLKIDDLKHEYGEPYNGAYDEINIRLK